MSDACKFKHYKHTLKQVPAKYLHRFLSLKSAADMLALELFPQSSILKEITESMSMWYAVEKIMWWDTSIDRSKDNVNIIVVGDGTKPRTACIFNYMTKWDTWSIDPQMRTRDYSKVKRLSISNKTIEESGVMNFEDQITIILMPHSHAPIKQCWEKIISTRKWLVKLECCTRDRLNFPCYYYKDHNIISPANDIYIWNNYLTLQNTE